MDPSTRKAILLFIGGPIVVITTVIGWYAGKYVGKRARGGDVETEATAPGDVSGESAAVRDLRGIASAQTTYYEQSPQKSFAPSLQRLLDSGAPGIDEPLVAGKKGGYAYTLEATDFSCLDPGGSSKSAQDCKQPKYGDWHAEAHPVDYGHTGKLSFYVGADMVIRGADRKGEAGSGDMQPLGSDSLDQNH